MRSTCDMMGLHCTTFHQEGVTFIKGQDCITIGCFVRANVATATAIGHLDDVVKVSRLSIGGQAILVFGRLDPVQYRGRVPIRRAEENTRTWG